MKLLILNIFILVSIYADDGQVMRRRSYEPANFSDSDFSDRKFYESEFVNGYVISPRVSDKNSSLPIIVYNRGGNSDYGEINEHDLRFMELLSRKGYVVVASN